MAKEIKLAKILPNIFDLVAIAFVAILLIIIGNSHQLLSYYGLDTSKQVLQAGAGSVVNTGLGRLDNFSFTDAVVTFLIWAVVGVFCFSVVQAIAGVYQEVRLNKQLSSDRFVHPATFTKAKFWKQVITTFVVLVVSLAVTALALLGLVGFILPTALAYARTFLIGFSLGDSGNLLLGLAIVFVWLVLLDVCFRVVFYHRRLVAN